MEEKEIVGAVDEIVFYVNGRKVLAILAKLLLWLL